MSATVTEGDRLRLPGLGGQRIRSKWTRHMDKEADMGPETYANLCLLTH